MYMYIYPYIYIYKGLRTPTTTTTITHHNFFSPRPVRPLSAATRHIMARKRSPELINTYYGLHGRCFFSFRALSTAVRNAYVFL